MSRLCRWGVVLLILGNGAATFSSAADIDSASAMYSHGVQAYFSGKLTRAEMYLYRASELNPNDPRPHYFRGLALMRQGRNWEAQEVLRGGATLEARSDTSAYGVGKALERVQGSDRLRLEEFRRAARLQTAASTAENARRRYEQLNRRQSQIQRTQFRLPLEALVNPVQPGQVAEAIASAEAAASVPVMTQPAEGQIATDPGDPFVDDPSNEAATESPAETAAGIDVAVPAAARESVKASSLPGIFGRMIGSRLPSVNVQGLRDRVPGLGGGGAPPPGVPGDFGEPGDFGDFGGEFPAPEGNPFDMQEPMPPVDEAPAEEPVPGPAGEEGDPFDF